MLYYNILIALRNIKNKRGFYAINITGLVIGLTACLMITHYVRFHKSFDKYQPGSESIYRVLYSRWSDEGTDRVEFASATPVIGRAIKENIPTVEMQGQAWRLDGVFSHEDKSFIEPRAFYAESNFITLLGIKIKYCKSTDILHQPTAAILSETMAKKYFGDEPAVGKTITYNNRNLFEVVAVFEDIPANSHFKADIFLAMEHWKNENPNIFTSGYLYSGFYNYIKLAPGTNPLEVEQQIAEYVDREYGEALAMGKINMGFKLQPLHDIHLKSHLMHEVELNGNEASINYLEIIAWFILLIAWVNFFNLSTITSIRRLREITIRKINGASRAQLIGQLLTESAIINLVAVVAAIVLFELAGNIFFNFADLPANTPVWKQPWVSVLLIIAFTVGTLSAGIYSVTGIPSSRLVEYLRGVSSAISGKRATRKFLTTIQFIIAIGLIAGTITIYRQYNLLMKKSPGFRLDNMMVVNAPLLADSVSLNRFKTLKNELSQQSDITGVTFSSVIPGKPNMYNRGGVYLYGSEPTTGKNFRVTDLDENFFKVYNIKVIEGEDFTGNTDTDRQRVMLNSSGALWFGFNTPAEAVGKKLVLENEALTITGIVDDFHQLSPREAIEPQIFRIARRHRGYLTLHLAGDDIAETAAQTGEVFKSFFPGAPYEYFMLDDYYYSQNAGERRFSVVFFMFSILVVLITILGLMGLSAYTALLKRREIGIRKVLGAGEGSLFRLLFREYLLLWVIGAMVALPLAWYLVDRWLASYAVRVEPGPLFFILPLVLVLLMALLTVLSQSVRILTMNPIDSIRSE